MTIIKSFTDLEQSKKLAEILPLESADMHYYNDWLAVDYHKNDQEYYDKTLDKYIPAWSLAVLLNVLDRGALFKTPQGWACQTYIEYETITSDYYNNPIDACVAMIEKLHEQKLL